MAAICGRQGGNKAATAPNNHPTVTQQAPHTPVYPKHCLYLSQTSDTRPDETKTRKNKKISFFFRHFPDMSCFNNKINRDEKSRR